MSIRKHRTLMFKLKYTSSLVNQRDKEIEALNRRIYRGNDFIMKVQRLIFKYQNNVLTHRNGEVFMTPIIDRASVPEEFKIKF